MKWKTQKKIVLTKEMIDDAKPHSVILTGEGFIEHPWFNHATKTVEDDGVSTRVNFVIFRGGIADWCIYHSMSSNLVLADYFDDSSHLLENFDRVLNHGAKVQRDKIIKGLVVCTDEVMKMYRH